MGKNHSVQINDEKLYMAMYEYCRANGKKMNELCTDMLRKQFMIEQYGDFPFGSMITKANEEDESKKETDIVAEVPFEDEEQKSIEMASTGKDEESTDGIIEVPAQEETESKVSVQSKSSQLHQKPLTKPRPKKRIL